jgi:hypothetical protein
VLRVFRAQTGLALRIESGCSRGNLEPSSPTPPRQFDTGRARRHGWRARPRPPARAGVVLAGVVRARPARPARPAPPLGNALGSHPPLAGDNASLARALPGLGGVVVGRERGERDDLELRAGEARPLGLQLADGVGKDPGAAVSCASREISEYRQNARIENSKNRIKRRADRGLPRCSHSTSDIPSILIMGLTLQRFGLPDENV